ncbi:hypothetical protein SOVF_194370 [Spinacia oleracea]|nr:hypothetical protein SOVF_194370 [Spinacia oleracea]
MFSSKGFDENDMMMGVMLSQKPGYDLIQNCDLPPPTKVFSGLSDNVKVIRKLGVDDDGDGDGDDGDRKLGLLKALRLSQTRAREAEAKYAAIIKERDALSCAFVQDSMQIFGYRQFVQLLEFQVSQFQQQQQQQQQQHQHHQKHQQKQQQHQQQQQQQKHQQRQLVWSDCGKRKQSEEGEEGDDGSESNGLTLLLTMAFCLGIAGFGFAIGCKYFYS